MSLEKQRQYNRKHYAGNKAYYIRKATIHREAAEERYVAWMLMYMRSHPCVDCGETDPLVLQFDHVVGSKVQNVSSMRAWSVVRLEEEVAKCEVRCANCHWRRTHEQRQTRLFRMLYARVAQLD